MPQIDRCICTDTSFAALRATAQADGLTLVQLVERTGAANRCGLCRPYLRRALRTGQSVFGEIIHDEDEPPSVPGPP